MNHQLIFYFTYNTSKCIYLFNCADGSILFVILININVTLNMAVISSVPKKSAKKTIFKHLSISVFYELCKISSPILANPDAGAGGGGNGIKAGSTKTKHGLLYALT